MNRTAGYVEIRVARRIYVTGLPYKTSWQDLKDYFRAAGNGAWPVPPDHRLELVTVRLLFVLPRLAKSPLPLPPDLVTFVCEDIGLWYRIITSGSSFAAPQCRPVHACPSEVSRM